MQPISGQFTGTQFRTDRRKFLINDVLDEGSDPENSSKALGSMFCCLMKSSTSLEHSEKFESLGDK